MGTNLSDTSVVSMQKFTLHLERNVEEFKDTNIPTVHVSGSENMGNNLSDIHLYMK